eukprot:m.165472 g.165472  ORF g.165472 m.165472 type:complete len:975 (-) comp23999_c0_seq3:258-3182(-)
MSGGGGGDVKVVVRFRPQQQRELRQGGGEVAQYDSTGRGVSMNGVRRAAFTFDRVFRPGSTQAEVYDYAAKPVVEDVLKGYNGTIFAYGQTSSGKTHTMAGPDIGGEERGIIPRIIDNIFSYIEIAPESFEFTVRMSYFEIYMEKIRDLLCEGSQNLQIHESRERGVYVRHATELYMQSPEEVLDVLDAGSLRRSVTETNMNDQSSRSHAVVLLELTQADTEKGGCKTGKLYLVDLAGSEKVSKTGADGTVLDEAKNINKSLSALGLVIMNLTDGNPNAHVPYRDSKLTRILQESLGGNSRTTIIICASPSSWNEQETLSSLNFGKRAKKIKNKAKINVQYSVAELERQLEDARKEIRKLVKTVSMYEDELEIWRGGGTVSEADRVNMKSTEIKSVAEEKQAQAAAATVVEAGISEEERENFMRQESELLDLLDDKDEEIRQLEKEVQSLGEDRVTITKLAGENQSFKELVKTLQEQLVQSQEDCADYEANIEELVSNNVTLDEDVERITTEKEDMEHRVKMAEGEARSQIKSIAEELSALSVANKGGGRQLPKLPNQAKMDPLIDGPLSKVRRHIADLQAAEATAKANESMVSQDKVAELEAELKGKLELELLRVEQTTMKLEEAMAAKEALKTKADAADRKVETLEQQCTELIEKLLESEEKILELEGAMETAASVSGEEHQSEVTRLKEKQMHNQKVVVDDLQTKLKATTAELETLRATKEELTEQKNSMELALKAAEAERDALQSSSEKLKGQIDAVSKQETEDRQSQAIIDAKNVRMSSFNDFKKAKWQELLDKQKMRLGKENNPDGGNAADGARPKSKVDEKLKEKLEELSRLKADLRALKTKDMRAETQMTVKDRELQKLQRQVLTQTQEVKTLKDNLKAQETRLKKVMERRRGGSSAGRLAGGGGGGRMSGGGGGGRQRPTISGGGKAVGASDSRTNVFNRGGRAGAATVAPAAAPAADPEQVEYV